MSGSDIVAFANAYLANNGPQNFNASSKALAGDETWTSGILIADVTLRSSGDAGIMTRVTNAGHGANEALGCYAAISSTGKVVLELHDGRKNIEIASAPMAVTIGRKYRLKMSNSGSTVKVWVDGVQVFDTVDSSAHKRGQIGLRTNFADVTFDNVKYTRTVDKDRFVDNADNGWKRFGGNFSLTGGAYYLNNANGTGTTGKSSW